MIIPTRPNAPLYTQLCGIPNRDGGEYSIFHKNHKKEIKIKKANPPRKMWTRPKTKNGNQIINPCLLHFNYFSLLIQPTHCWKCLLLDTRHQTREKSNQNRVTSHSQFSPSPLQLSNHPKFLARKYHQRPVYQSWGKILAPAVKSGLLHRLSVCCQPATPGFNGFALSDGTAILLDDQP